ncbi:hypothetical protein AB0F81_36650 [Actinoplanes sp. NPDC024001]|uniref:hypothetical protein n=1 Tax=Actinoplanes sp. NPDC024001 TaxID=3154598 RepID=UPI0033CF2B19
MESFEELLHALDRAGLWSEIPKAGKRDVVAALTSGKEVTWRAGGVWNVDGEDMADGDVEQWLTSMADPLRDCGVDLRVDSVIRPHDPESTGYAISVNGQRLDLYSFVEGEPHLPDVEDAWTDCSVRPAARVNSLLATAGSSRRVALFWPGWNFGTAVLGEERVLRRFTATFWRRLVRRAAVPANCVIP